MGPTIMKILGISYTMHESSACLLDDGELVFAAAEERFTRKNKDSSFPVHAIQAALDFAEITPAEIDHVAISWPRPHVRFKHNLKTILKGNWPRTSWMRWERLWLQFVKDIHHRGGELDFCRKFGKPRQPIHFVKHHLAHALSSYVMSEFDEAAVLVVDGRGAEDSTTLWQARGNDLHLLERYKYPNSLGVFYAGITDMLGFQPFSDEWKVMGLAAYGDPTCDLSPLLIAADGSYRVEGWRFFGRTDADRSRLAEVVGPRRNGEDLEPKHQNLARSAQQACEQAMQELLQRIVQLTGSRNLCLAGGVALNSKANGELLRSGLIDHIYIQPAAGDDGAAIGAAYAVYQKLGLPFPRKPIGHTNLGPSFSNAEIEKVLSIYKLPHSREPNVSRRAAELLAENRLIAWFQGRMEFGPRALGMRSILADPRYVENRDRVNAAVKFREGWRPFAPSILIERGAEYFDDFYPSPYMILTFWANRAKAHEIPAVVHVDGSARVQSVERSINPLYYDLIDAFGRLTGVPIVLNTSFNLKGDPIVCTPRDAIQTFYTSGLDDLIIGDFLVSKSPSRPSRFSTRALAKTEKCEL
jgi:carbamoyltransferase